MVEHGEHNIILLLTLSKQILFDVASPSLWAWNNETSFRMWNFEKRTVKTKKPRKSILTKAESRFAKGNAIKQQIIESSYL